MQGWLWCAHTFCYGFIWIPLWWLVTRSSLSQAEAADRIASPRKPVLSYAISGLFALAFAWGMIRPIVDPEGYKAFKAEQARKSEEQARADQERRAAQAVSRATQEAERKVASERAASARSPANTKSRLPAVRAAILKINVKLEQVNQRALSTPRIALGGPISEMQALLQEAQSIPTAGDIGDLKNIDMSPGDRIAAYVRANYIMGLDYQIKGWLAIMSGGPGAGASYIEASTKHFRQTTEGLTNPQSIVPDYRE